MENYVNSQEMLCNKIYAHPRIGFFTIAGSGDKQNKKTNIFSNSTSIKLSFALGHGIFHGIGTP